MYSAEEIQASVEKLVRGSIRRPTDTLGVRRVDVAFSDVQEAGATVLLLNSAGPFYCLALGAQRLKDTIQTEAAVLDQLLDAIAATGRRVLPVETVDMLFGAKAALEELEGAAAARTQGFKDITKVPSYQRFASNVQTFLDGPSQNIKSGGDIVQTPEQAKQAIPNLVRQLAELHLDLVARAQDLAFGIDDFKSVNLPALVASGAISRAREVLGRHADELEALSKDDRLLKVRDVTLDVLAAKAVVTQFGSFSGPSTYYALSGVGGPYADSTRPATPAEVESTSVDAVSIFLGSNRLEVTADGALDLQTLDLEPSVVAAVNSTTSEGGTSSIGWLIGDGTDPAPPPDVTTPDNNELRFKVGSTTYPVTLTLSPDFTTFRSAQDICDDISGQVPGNVLTATPIFSPLEYSGPLDIAAGMLTTTFSVPAGASDLIALGVKVGHLVKVKNGANAGLYEIASVATTSFTATRPSGTFAAQTGANCEVGPQYRRIRIELGDPASQVPIQEKLTILADTTKSANACNTLGFFPGITVQCRLTTIDEVVEQVNGKTNKFAASSAYAALVTSATAHSDPLNSRVVTFPKTSGTATISWAGPVAILEGPIDFTKVQVGDVAALRSGPNPNLYGVVTNVFPNQSKIEVIAGAPGTDALSVAYEIGVPFTPTEYMTVRIDDGPNRGDYLVEGVGVTPLDVVLKSNLPQTRSGIDPLSFSASIGHKALVLKGKSTGLSAELSVDGTAASTFFTTVPADAFGTTPYFQLPQIPRGIQAGDVLELYNTQYNVPSSTHVIELVDASVRVIRVSPELSTHLPTPPPTKWVFADQVPPFARVRITQTYDFATFQARVEAWAARDVNQAQYFSDVNRKMNPILVNTNVTGQQVQDALNIVLPIYQALSASVATNTGADSALTLEYAIAQYQVPPVAAVDTLLRSYKEKGSDRAVDLLLQGLFQTFFGLGLDDASYAGAMQSAMRDVAREDLAVRRVERSDAGGAARQVSSADSPDYDYDSSDIEHGAQVDPPES